jgi:hypothetical protein
VPLTHPRPSLSPPPHLGPGPYTIGIDDFAFGLPARYLQLSPDKLAAAAAGGAGGAGGVGVGVGAAAHAADARTPAQVWDACLDGACDVYSGRMHNLLFDNCHSHVARALNAGRYAGRADWNMVLLAAWMFLRGKPVTTARAVAAWAPFAILVVVVLALRYGLR